MPPMLVANASRATDPVVVELKRPGSRWRCMHPGRSPGRAVTDQVYLAVRSRRRVARQRETGADCWAWAVFVRAPPRRLSSSSRQRPALPAAQMPKQAKRLVAAFDRLAAIPTRGGATRHGLVTATGQDAVACARFLRWHGPSKAFSSWPTLAEVPVARRIMATTITAGSPPDRARDLWLPDRGRPQGPGRLGGRVMRLNRVRSNAPARLFQAAAAHPLKSGPRGQWAGAARRRTISSWRAAAASITGIQAWLRSASSRVFELVQ